MDDFSCSTTMHAHKHDMPGIIISCILSSMNRSPSLVNFGLADTFPNLPQYNSLQSPTVEIVGDMAHVYVIITYNLSIRHHGNTRLLVHRHPLAVSTALRARNFKDIIFVTDSVMEPKEGASVNYINRKCRKEIPGNDSWNKGFTFTALFQFLQLCSKFRY